eukprot:14468239-Alexandrium_andersonii.AAC.2
MATAATVRRRTATIGAIDGTDDSRCAPPPPTLVHETVTLSASPDSRGQANMLCNSTRELRLEFADAVHHPRARARRAT